MKAIFHDEEDGRQEPVDGLPEALPAGERVLWQGRPSGVGLAIHALRLRFVALYVAIFALWRFAAIAARDGAGAEYIGVLTTSALGLVIGGGLLSVLGWLMARSTIYTITNRRVVLRYGVGIRKYVNVPFSIVESASLKRHNRGAGSIALTVSKGSRIGYLHLWPHARPGRYARAEPMLRAVPDAADVARLLCDAVKANAPNAVAVTLGDRTATPHPVGAGDAVAAA